MGAPCPRAKPSGSSVAPHAARFIFRGDADVAGLLPAPHSASSSRLRPAAPKILGARAALWLGPDEWLLIAEGEEPEPMAATLDAALAPRAHSLVDVSQRQIGLELEGPLTARALNAGCPLDLREVSFPVGMATRTMIAKAEAVVWRRAPKRFHVEIWTFVRRLRRDIPQRSRVARSRVISVHLRSDRRPGGDPPHRAQCVRRGEGGRRVVARPARRRLAFHQP